MQHILELLQINGNWIAILRFCFTLELLKLDKYELKVNKGLSQNPTAQARTQQSLGRWSNESHNIQHRWKQKKCSIAQHLFYKHFWSRANFMQHDTTTSNMIQQHTTRWSNVQTFSSQQMLHVVAWKVGIVWLGLDRMESEVQHCSANKDLIPDHNPSQLGMYSSAGDTENLRKAHNDSNIFFSVWFLKWIICFSRKQTVNTRPKLV